MVTTPEHGDRCDFRLIPATIYGAEQKNMKFVGTLAAEMTTHYQVVASEAHRQVYPYLPDTVPDDETAYPWWVFKRPSGDLLVVGMSWIEDNSLIIHGDTQVYRYTVTGSYSVQTRAQAALRDAGVFNYTAERLGGDS